MRHTLRYSLPPLGASMSPVSPIMHGPRRRRLEHLLCYLVLLSALRPGVDTFSVANLRRPSGSSWATACRTRRSASTAVLAANGDHHAEDTSFSTVEDLQVLTVVRLKAELKARGLKQTGKKADLVRLLANTPGVLGQPPPNLPGEDEHEPPGSTDEKSGVRARRSQPASSKEGSAASAEAEEIVGGMHRESTFNTPIGAALASELIVDAELATSTSDVNETASLDEEEDDDEDVIIQEDDYSSSSSFGEELYDDPTRARPLPNGFHRVAQPPPVLPQLPPPTEDMKRREIIMDMLERRTMNFDLENPVKSGGLPPQGGAYVVYTKKALRPWEGPHASRAETHVVVLLSDVFGWEDPFTRSTADQVADICDAIVVVPDIFRKRPWDHQQPEGAYEEWRASHDPEVVAADIRACVAHARAEYKPTSLGLMGFCYGGGRALEEAAAGVVKPDNVVVFYPTRYDAHSVGANVACPVSAFFAEYDNSPGATVEDAHTLLEQLLNNDDVPDAQVKLCPGADHGFAHRPMTKDREKAEDAMLLATSWLELYLHKHFPAKKGGVKQSEFGFWELPARDGVASSPNGRSTP